MLITGGMTGAVIYLVFVFPSTLLVWHKEARALSVPQRLMANASGFCISYGLLLLAFLLLSFLASLVWMILAAMKKTTANNEVQAIS
jgi:type II secretory pathway component PulF